MANKVDRLPPKPPPAGAIVTVKRPAQRWHRVHSFDPKTQKYASDAFNDSTQGDARFSPLLSEDNTDTPEQLHVIPTLYAAASERAAIAEIVLRNVPSPSAGYLHDLRSDLDSNLQVSTLQAPALTLANLTTTGMHAAGMLAPVFTQPISEHTPTIVAILAEMGAGIIPDL